MENNTPKVQVKDIQLPFFEGFYYSPLIDDELIDMAINDEVEYHNNELGMNVTEDDFEFDYKEYQKNIVDCFTTAFKDYLPNWVADIETPSLDSPQYYNYETDKIFVTATLEDDWEEQIKVFFSDNRDWLKKRIKSDWTSRSGFFSYIENDYDAFLEKALKAEPIYLSIVIGYAIELQEEKDTRDMYIYMTDQTLEDFYSNHPMTEYVRLNNEKEQEFANETCTDAGNTANCI